MGVCVFGGCVGVCASMAAWQSSLSFEDEACMQTG
jgi:hypothetical protein